MIGACFTTVFKLASHKHKAFMFVLEICLKFSRLLDLNNQLLDLNNQLTINSGVKGM